MGVGGQSVYSYKRKICYRMTPITKFMHNIMPKLWYFLWWIIDMSYVIFFSVYCGIIGLLDEFLIKFGRVDCIVPFVLWNVYSGGMWLIYYACSNVDWILKKLSWRVYLYKTVRIINRKDLLIYIVFDTRYASKIVPIKDYYPSRRTQWIVG